MPEDNLGKRIDLAPCGHEHRWVKMPCCAPSTLIIVKPASHAHIWSPSGRISIRLDGAQLLLYGYSWAWSGPIGIVWWSRSGSHITIWLMSAPNSIQISPDRDQKCPCNTAIACKTATEHISWSVNICAANQKHGFCVPMMLYKNVYLNISQMYKYLYRETSVTDRSISFASLCQVSYSRKCTYIHGMLEANVHKSMEKEFYISIYKISS